MSVLIFHWLVCRISEKVKLKRFYDYVNRQFDCSLAVRCQRSITSLRIAQVLSLIAINWKNTIAKAVIFSHVIDHSGILIVVIVTTPPPVCLFTVIFSHVIDQSDILIVEIVTKPPPPRLPI